MKVLDRFMNLRSINKNISKIMKNAGDRDWIIQISKTKEEIDVKYSFSEEAQKIEESYLQKFGFTGVNCHPQWISTTKSNVFFYIWPENDRYMQGFMAFLKPDSTIKCDKKSYKLDSKKFSREPIHSSIYKELCKIMPEPMC